MGLRGLGVWGRGPSRGGCSGGRPAAVCLPRCARSEMTSLFSQSFRPAVTRRAVSGAGQRGQGWAAGPVPTQGKSPQRSCGCALPSRPCYPPRGPATPPRAGSLTPAPAGPLSWHFLVLRPGSVSRFLFPLLSGTQAQRPSPASSSDPTRVSGLPRLDSLPRGQVAQTPWPVALVTACLLGPGTPRNHILPCRRGWPRGPATWPDIGYPGRLHQTLGPRAPSRLPERDPPCPLSPAS